MLGLRRSDSSFHGARPGRHWWRQTLVMLATTVGLVVGVASPAWAHATLDESDPAAGSVISQPPDAIVLRFSEPVETQLGSIKVFDGSRRLVQTSAPHHSDGNRTVRVTLPTKLNDGTYVVSWRVVSADSHPVGSTFTFTVGPPGTRPTAVSVDGAAVPSDRAVGVGFGLVRFVAFATLALVVGGGIFVAALHPAAAAQRSVRRLLITGWAAALVTSLLGIGFQGAYAAGGPLADMVEPSLWRGVAGTEFGRAWLARAAILCIGALLLRAVLRRREPLPRVLFASWCAVLLGLVLTVVAAGHALTGRWILVGAISDVLHVAAMAFWLGGLVLLLAVLRRVEPDTLRELLPRFSRLAFGAVVIIVASGVVQSWRQLGSLHALTSSSYGRLLLVKVAFVCLLVGLAGLSRRLLISRLRAGPPERSERPQPIAVGAAVAIDEPGDLRRRLRQTVLGEVVTALVVLAVTAGLVNAAPPPRISSGPFNTQISLGTLQADVVIDPPKVGPSQLHLYMATATGEPAKVAEVTADLTQPPALTEPLPVKFTRITQNHFVANDLVFPFAGRWTIQLKAHLGEFDEQTAVVTVRVS